MLHSYFSQPLLLLLLLPVPLLLWWWWRGRRGSIRIPDAVSLRKLPAGRRRRAFWGGLLLRTLGVICLVIALAGPRWPDEGSRIPAKGMSIAIVLDVSGSMAEKDFSWHGEKVSRLAAVKKVFHLFVEGGKGPEGKQFQGRPQDLISLVVFATRPETLCPLTLNHDVLLELLEKQKPRVIPGESRTNIGDAIIWGLKGLKEAGKGRKVMVLLSDGEHNVEPPALKPRQAAQLAFNFHVPIYVIDAGKESTNPTDVEDAKINRKRAKKILEEVAKISKGKYFQAQDTDKLLEVSQEIDKLERAKFPSYIYLRYHEGFMWFALAAFVFFVGIHGLEWTFWRRLP